LAIQAAEVSGDAGSARNVARALLESGGGDLTALRVLANSSRADGNDGEALALARRAAARKDAPRWSLEMIVDIHIARGAWADALAEIDSRGGRQAFAPEAHRRLKAAVATRVAERAVSEGRFPAAVEAAHSAVESGGGGAAVVVLARALAAQGKARKAVAVIERAWPEFASARLLETLRAVKPDESPLDWAKRVETLAARAPEHPESRLAVAAASLGAGLWGQARNRLMPLLGDDIDPPVRFRAALLMADVEQAERGDTTASVAWLKRATAAAAERPPQTPVSVADVLAGAA
jgi:HemY protein